MPGILSGKVKRGKVKNGRRERTASDSSFELLSLELLVTPRSDLLDGGGAAPVA